MLREALSPSRLANAPLTVDSIHRQLGDSIIYVEGHFVAAATLWQLQGVAIGGWLTQNRQRQWQPLALTGRLITSLFGWAPRSIG